VGASLTRPHCLCRACSLNRVAPYGPPLTCIDPAARRVAWVLYVFGAVVGLGLIAYEYWKVNR
jgi:hypothetical protein